MGNYKEIYINWQKDPKTFWKKQSENIHWEREPKKILDDDNKPFFNLNNETSSALDLSASIGTSLVTLSATDYDAGDTLNYSITSGNSTGAFAINSKTGELTTAKSFDASATVNFWDASSTAVASKTLSEPALNSTIGLSDVVVGS